MAKFAKFSKSNRSKRAALQGQLDSCLAQIAREEKLIAEAEEAKRRRAADHAAGHAYVSGGLEDIVIFLETRRAMLDALKERAESLGAQIDALDNPSPAEASQRAINQRRLVRIERQRARLTVPIREAADTLAKLLKQHCELSMQLVSVARAVELEAYGLGPWLEGDSGKSLLGSLSKADMEEEDQRFRERFFAELAGEEIPAEPPKHEPLPTINSVESAKDRYERWRGAQRPSPKLLVRA